MGKGGKITMNYLFNENLSLKEKGLLTILLNLSETNKPTYEKLKSLSMDGERAIKKAIKGLKEKGYLKIEKIAPKCSINGHFSYNWQAVANKQQQEG